MASFSWNQDILSVRNKGITQSATFTSARREICLFPRFKSHPMVTFPLFIQRVLSGSSARQDCRSADVQLFSKYSCLLSSKTTASVTQMFLLYISIFPYPPEVGFYLSIQPLAMGRDNLNTFVIQSTFGSICKAVIFYTLHHKQNYLSKFLTKPIKPYCHKNPDDRPGFQTAFQVTFLANFFVTLGTSVSVRRHNLVRQSIKVPVHVSNTTYSRGLHSQCCDS